MSFSNTHFEHFPRFGDKLCDAKRYTEQMATAEWTSPLPFPALCRGDRDLLEGWITGSQRGSVWMCLLFIVVGLSSYGFTVGLWRGWEMASYVAIKLPAAILCTLLINGLLNGMLALALGSGIGFRQSLQFLLAGFGIMSIILGALSPVTFFLALNTPAASDPGAGSWHAFTLLTHTGAIALAGIMAHRKLLEFVRDFADSRQSGTRTFFAWLLGNLFVGAQVSWILRPFFGSPGLEVQFLRSSPLEGSFYEAVFHAASRLLGL